MVVASQSKSSTGRSDSRTEMEQIVSKREHQKSSKIQRVCFLDLFRSNGLGAKNERETTSIGENILQY
jgi:hypothetical protein